tara:strand:+ start:362 stop:511 length:150 start_codon:yes stop_codon:yes gene_type:complete
MVETETARLVHHPMITEKPARNIANNNVWTLACTATISGIKNVVITPVQ